MFDYSIYIVYYHSHSKIIKNEQNIVTSLKKCHRWFESTVHPATLSVESAIFVN